MKPKFSWIVVLLLISPALALEAPVDDAPPPPLLKKGVETTPQSTPQERYLPENPESSQSLPSTQKTAFLGLVTAEVPDLLSEHLRLKIGEGIMVRALMPDGPATKAGVAIHDVILRVSGNAVATPADLSSEISKHRVGNTIQLDLIHQGQTVTREVVLGERPPQVSASAPSRRDRFSFKGLPEDQEQQLRDLLEQQQLEAAPQEIDPRMDMMRRMQERMNRMLQDESGASQEAIPRRRDSGIQAQSQATVRVMDHQGSVELKSSDGKKEITTYDSSGKMIWQGPWTTPEDQAAAPAEIRERISRLHLDTNFQGKSLRFNLRPGPPGEH